MLSPAGMQNLESDFVARWMPCSSRAGVILNPSLDLARSLRSSSSWAAQDVDDSFSAQFAPLPYSSNSSSVSVDYIGPEAATATCMSDQLSGKATVMDLSNATSALHTDPSSVIQGFSMELDSADPSKQPPEDLMLKLEELRAWQQQVQEKLKAHQMEQLQQLLEEQQRLLGLVHITHQASAGDAEVSQFTEGEWEEVTVLEQPPQAPPPDPQHQPLSPLQCSPRGPSLQCTAAALHPHPEEEEAEESGRAIDRWKQQWRDDQPLGNRREHDDDDDDDEDDSQLTTLSVSAASPQAVDRTGEDLQQEDRPIRPGIGGRSQTFEELLEEQLKMEEQRLKSGLQKPSPMAATNPKRPFLKRGEGLSRFTRGKTPPAGREGKEVPRVQPKLSVPQSAEPSEERHRPPIHRKTAVLGKEPSAPPASTNRARPEVKPGSALRPCSFPGPHRQNSNGPNRALPHSRGKQPKSTNPQLQEGPSPPKSQNAPGGRAVAREVESMGQSGVTVAVQRQEVGGAGLKVAAQGTARAAPGQVTPLELSSWDVERQRERVELGEFELLEQAAEELSFSSNSSFVIKVLELDRQNSRGRQHFRRLSSTPIKSLPKASLPKVGQGGEAGAMPGQTESAWATCPTATVTTSWGDSEAGFGRQEAEETSDPGGSDSERAEDSLPEPEALRNKPALPSSPCFSPSQAQYDKTSYQDEDGGRGGECDDAGDHDNSTLMEGDGQGQGLVFDDDDTWNDTEDAGNGEDDDSDAERGVITHNAPGAGSDGMLRRKVSVARATPPESEPQGNSNDEALEPPPTSQLVAKLFPSLKPKAKPTPAAPPGTAVEPGAGPQSRLLRERLVELELEIERFRSENAALASQRLEREKALEALRKERAEFERMKAEELAKLEELKKEEMRKLQKERKLFEKHASAARAIPDKKEREEIQSLKQQLSSVQEELRRREARWSSTHGRLRQQLEALGTENSALREEVRALERLRLSAWKRDEADRGKEREKDSSRKSMGVSVITTTRSKSTSPPGAVKAVSSLSSSAKEAQRRSSPPCRASQGSSSRKSPSVPAPMCGTQKWAGPDQEWPITAQRPKTPISPPMADKPQTELCEEEEERSQEEFTHPDGKVERVLPCGGRLILFPNGTRKEVSADGRSVRVTFFNGDVKQIMEDQRVIYYYADAQTTHTTYPDGMEKHFPDGRKEITFPDQTVKNLGPDGEEESVFPDGTIIQVKRDGTKVIQFNSGQKEVHTEQFKRREYPDGTVKTVYSDGRQETRYPTGRLRIKDKDGRVVMDTRT
ncbi:hypothetical protein JZ751_025523 [Albula glossodonta]|uniref:Centromere protein J n=1 Tax=Albula glossodonta TaxID=121402 RepID=A0A8T2MY57_9TELE|nr:hypothetical protein JZ751_025523 [Albula glossodonta]